MAHVCPKLHRKWTCIYFLFPLWIIWQLDHWFQEGCLYFLQVKIEFSRQRLSERLSEPARISHGKMHSLGKIHSLGFLGFLTHATVATVQFIYPQTTLKIGQLKVDIGRYTSTNWMTLFLYNSIYTWIPHWSSQLSSVLPLSSQTYCMVNGKVPVLYGLLGISHAASTKGYPVVNFQQILPDSFLNEWKLGARVAKHVCISYATHSIDLGEYLSKWKPSQILDRDSHE